MAATGTNTSSPLDCLWIVVVDWHVHAFVEKELGAGRDCCKLSRLSLTISYARAGEGTPIPSVAAALGGCLLHDERNPRESRNGFVIMLETIMGVGQVGDARITRRAC